MRYVVCKHRDTMLQALRGCIVGAGSKLIDKTRKDVTALLIGYISSSEDSTRITAAACLGCLCASLPDDELSSILTQHVLGQHTLSFFSGQTFLANVTLGYR